MLYLASTLRNFLKTHKLSFLRVSICTDYTKHIQFVSQKVLGDIYMYF